MSLRQRGRDFFNLLKIYFVAFFSTYTGICKLVYVCFVLTKEVLILGVLVNCVLNPWRLLGSRFELSYAKATRRHLCQLDHS